MGRIAVASMGGGEGSESRGRVTGCGRGRLTSADGFLDFILQRGPRTVNVMLSHRK